MVTVDPPQILIADDDRVIRSYLSIVLGNSGYVPLQADDGRTTLSMLSRMSVDLLLLDVYMPDTHGLEILHAVRNRWPTVPVILITGMATIDCAVAAIRQGAVDFLSKPFQIDKLLLVIARALEERKCLLQANASGGSIAGDPLGSASQRGRPEGGLLGDAATLPPADQLTPASGPVRSSLRPPAQPGEALPALKVPSQRHCCYCHSQALYPSKPHYWEWLMKLILYRPHRCEVCLKRQWCWG